MFTVRASSRGLARAQAFSVLHHEWGYAEISFIDVIVRLHEQEKVKNETSK